jgi:Tol biopolymer transport system component
MLNNVNFALLNRRQPIHTSSLRFLICFTMVWFSLPAYAQEEGGRSDEMWPRFSPDGEHIAYVSNYDGNFNAYVMDRNGENVIQLTDDPDWDSNLNWSPDGERLVFASTRSGNGDIYVVNADGSDLTQLTDTPNYESSPTWSPNGTRIIFSRRLEDGTVWSFAPFVMNADGSEQRNLIADFWDAQGEAVDGHAIWSPDGSQIALTVYMQRGDNSSCMNPGSVYILDVETGVPDQIVQLGGGGSIALVRWNGDAITLAKRIDEDCPTTLEEGWYTLDLTERSLTAERYRNADSYYPSPDGEQVAFYGGDFEIREMGLGVASRRFTDARTLVISPFYNAFGLDWSPDGRYFIGSLCTETDADLFLIDNETGDATNLTADISEAPSEPPRECGAYG